MARPPRPLIPGGFYHVTARGNERRVIFRDDIDRERFLGILADVVEEAGWSLLAYCLMDNHFHLLVLTPEPNLAAGMQRLNGTYAQWFNLRHDRVGHLFQGRYGAKVIRTESQFRATVRYIVWNPVRGGLCESPSQYRWSSHCATLGATEAPQFLAVKRLLALFGPNRERARQAYRRLCASDTSGRLDRMTLRELELAFLLDGRTDTAAIGEARASGFSMRQIALHLGVDASTVSRRLRATVSA